MGCALYFVCKAGALAAAALIVLGALGVLRLPLPAPAHGKYANPVPAGVLDWQPRPLQGEFALNDRLKSAVRLFEGQVFGSESVAVGPDGQLVMLDRYNHLYEAWQAADGSSGRWKLNSQPLAKLGAGRPLGYHFDGEGNLIVCDSLKGLIKYDYVSKDITILDATHVSASSAIDPGSEITYANDLAIASDGTIYYTSCTDVVPPLNAAGFYDTYRAWFLGLMQGLPKGRLLKYNPHTKETHVVAKGFYYANGIALSADESYVVMVETDRLSAHKIWVKGPEAGRVELLIDQLPGAPDGVDTSSDGSFWISLVAPAPPFKSWLLSKHLANPLVRAVHAWLPAWVRPGLKAWGAVVKVSGDGKVRDFLTDPQGEVVSTVSAVSEHELPGGRKLLFLGNLVGNYVSYVELTPTSDESSGSKPGAAGPDAQAAAGPDSSEPGHTEEL